MACYSQVDGVNDYITGITIMLKNSRLEDSDIDEIMDVSIIIFCTGYQEATNFLPNSLNSFTYNNMWQLQGLGLDLTTWKMKNNPYSKIMGHVKPSTSLEMTGDIVFEKFHRRLLINNPNMMVLSEMGEVPLLDIDVCSWLLLAYITGERKVPTTKELKEDHLQELLMLMDDHGNRLEMDANYNRKYKRLSVSFEDNIWIEDVASEEYSNHLFELTSLQYRFLARDMKDAKYPLQIGDIDNLNEVGIAMMKMEHWGDLARAMLEYEDEDTKRWKTFRDADPSECRSFITGNSAIALKGKWLEIDNEGNLLSGKNE